MTKGKSNHTVYSKDAIVRLEKRIRKFSDENSSGKVGYVAERVTALFLRRPGLDDLD